MLTVELLRPILRPLDGRAPCQHELRGLRHRVAVLHADLLLDDVVVGAEVARLADAKAEAVLTREHEVGLRPLLHELQALGRELERNDLSRGAGALDHETGGPEQARDHEGLLAPIVQLPLAELTAAAAHGGAIERAHDLRRPLRNRRRGDGRGGGGGRPAGRRGPRGPAPPTRGGARAWGESPSSWAAGAAWKGRERRSDTA